MKKLAIAGVSVALMLAVAVPAFANSKHQSTPTVNVTNVNSVSVSNTGDGHNLVLTGANTGFNAVSGKKGSITTGAAYAGTVAGNVVGTTYVEGCNTCSTGAGSVTNGSVYNSNTVAVGNSGDGFNGVATIANSGVNYVSGNGGTIHTGAAKAGSLVVNVVGTTIVGK